MGKTQHDSRPPFVLAVTRPPLNGGGNRMVTRVARTIYSPEQIAVMRARFISDIAAVVKASWGGIEVRLRRLKPFFPDGLPMETACCSIRACVALNGSTDDAALATLVKRATVTTADKTTVGGGATKAAPLATSSVTTNAVGGRIVVRGQAAVNTVLKSIEDLRAVIFEAASLKPANSSITSNHGRFAVGGALERQVQMATVGVLPPPTDAKDAQFRSASCGAPFGVDSDAEVVDDLVDAYRNRRLSLLRDGMESPSSRRSSDSDIAPYGGRVHGGRHTVAPPARAQAAVAAQIPKPPAAHPERARPATAAKIPAPPRAPAGPAPRSAIRAQPDARLPVAASNPPASPERILLTKDEFVARLTAVPHLYVSAQDAKDIADSLAPKGTPRSRPSSARSRRSESPAANIDVQEFVARFGSELLKPKSMRNSLGKQHNDGKTNAMEWTDAVPPPVDTVESVFSKLRPLSRSGSRGRRRPMTARAGR